MLSQLRRRVPEEGNRPMTRSGASQSGAQARLSGRRGAAGATSGAITSRHFMRMPIARVETPDGAAGAKGAPARGPGRNEDREAGHGRNKY
jgi:hypothetical protein